MDGDRLKSILDELRLRISDIRPEPGRRPANPEEAYQLVAKDALESTIRYIEHLQPGPTALAENLSTLLLRKE